VLFFFWNIDSTPSESWYQILGIVGGAAVLVAAGFLDDYGRLHSQIKLFVAMPLATMFLAAGGVRIVTWPFVDSLREDPNLTLLISLSLTLVWVVGITASLSIFDHMDGLCSGIAAVASGFFLVSAVIHGQILVGVLAAAVLGSTLGFLFWNFNPARIFLGDSGALLMGFLMATLGLKVKFPDLSEIQSWMVPVLILGVPIFDTALIIVSRIRRGLLPFASPGKDHTAHRLANLGFSHRSTVLILYGAGISLGSLALLVANRLSPTHSYVLIAGLSVTAIVAIMILERVPFQRQKPGPG
jgi:UDP-GlcNAc:undecaprenyl-phosphate GlcNAc-1-phosphate transferase